MKKQLQLIVAGVVLASAFVVAQFDPAAAAQPPYEPDPGATGVLRFYDEAGAVKTSGNITDKPFAAFVQSSAAGRQGDNKATLFGYLPKNGVETSGFAGEALTGSRTYPNAAAPGDLGSSALPLVTVNSTDVSIGELAADFPNTATDAYQGLYQLRVKTSGPGQPAGAEYSATSILVEGNTWTQVYPVPVPPTTTTTSTTTTVPPTTTTTVPPTTTTTIPPTTTTTIPPTTTTTVAPTTTTTVPPGSGEGELVICAVDDDGDDEVEGALRYVVGREEVEVPLGECSDPIAVKAGDRRVTQRKRSNVALTDCETDPEDALVDCDPELRRAVVNVADGEQTTVTFHNRVVGAVRLCVISGDGVKPGTKFRFVVGKKNVTVAAQPADDGTRCVVVEGFERGSEVDIKQKAKKNTAVSLLEIRPADREITSDAESRTATVLVGRSKTTVEFTETAED